MWNTLTALRISGISKRDIKIEHSIHRKRLSRVSSRIDNAPPKKMRHVSVNSKGRYLEQAKRSSIMKSNKNLVEKLIRVDSRENSLLKPRKITSSLNRSKKVEEFSRITNENFRMFSRLQTCRPHYSKARQDREYLNITKIQRRIQTQNKEKRMKINSHILFNPVEDRINSVKCLGNAQFDFVL